MTRYLHNNDRVQYNVAAQLKYTKQFIIMVDYTVIQVYFQLKN